MLHCGVKQTNRWDGPETNSVNPALMVVQSKHSQPNNIQKIAWDSWRKSMFKELKLISTFPHLDAPASAWLWECLNSASSWACRTFAATWHHWMSLATGNVWHSKLLYMGRSEQALKKWFWWFLDVPNISEQSAAHIVSQLLSKASADLALFSTSFRAAFSIAWGYWEAHVNGLWFDQYLLCRWVNLWKPMEKTMSNLWSGVVYFGCQGLTHTIPHYSPFKTAKLPGRVLCVHRPIASAQSQPVWTASINA